MDRLISMTDFVLEQGNPSNTDSQFSDKVMAYANFLKQPLTLGMFVPCKLVEGVWVVLEKPDLTCKRPESKGNCQCGEESVKDCREWWNEYQEAKDRVLFEGFEVIKWDHGGDSYSIRKNSGKKEEIQVCYYKAVPNYFVWSFDTIEQLTTKDLVLTESAKKQIG